MSVYDTNPTSSDEPTLVLTIPINSLGSNSLIGGLIKALLEKGPQATARKVHTVIFEIASAQTDTYFLIEELQTFHRFYPNVAVRLDHSKRHFINTGYHNPGQVLNPHLGPYFKKPSPQFTPHPHFTQGPYTERPHDPTTILQDDFLKNSDVATGGETSTPAEN